MKKYKDPHIYNVLQQRLDTGYGKGIWKAAAVLLLFCCLTLSSCINDKNEKVPDFPVTEQPAPAQPAPPVKITITDTKQKAVPNNLKELYKDHLVVRDAYFAKRVEAKGGAATYEKISSSAINETVYVIVDTFNLGGQTVHLKILDRDGIITKDKYGAVEFLQNGTDKTGDFTSKVSHYEGDDMRFAVFEINLKNKDDKTTAEWTDNIEKSKDKKLNLCLAVDVPDKNHVTYCGENPLGMQAAADNKVWLDQEGKWFEVNAELCVCDDWSDVPSFISSDNFIGWGYAGVKENCFDYAWKELKDAGYDLKSPSWSSTRNIVNPDIYQIYLTEDVAGLTKGTQKEEFKKGIKYLKDSIKNSTPVLVGVDDQTGSANPDKVTDHFVIITGMGSDTTGNYFSFHDNAVGNQEIGASDANKLYCSCKDLKLEGDIDSRNSYAHNPKRYGKYTVTQIRESKKK